MYLRHVGGTTGLNLPVDVSHKIERSEHAKGINSKFKEGALSSSFQASVWCLAISFRSSPVVKEWQTGILERASATLLALPATCWIFVENSEMREMWRCCLADHGSDFREKMNTKGL